MADVDSKTVYLKNTSTISQQRCGTKAVPGRKKAGPTVGQVGQEQRNRGASEHSRYSAGVGKLQFMINEVPDIAYAVKNLSRQLAKPEAVCAIHVGTNDRSLH